MTRDEMPTARSAIAIRLLLIGAISFAISTLLPLEQGPAMAGLKATTYSLSAVFAVVLLLPDNDERVLETMAWCAAGAFLAAIVVLADSSTRVLWAYAPRLLMTVFVLTATFSIVRRVLGTSLLIALFAMLTMLPVWAAPLVELTGNPDWLNRAVINASPVTAVAVAVDLDFLRSEWFYANSALGSMRYDYPGWIPIILAYSVIPSALLFYERLRSAPFQKLRKEAHP